jgi:hypothetical protein
MIMGQKLDRQATGPQEKTGGLASPISCFAGPEWRKLPDDGARYPCLISVFICFHNCPTRQTWVCFYVQRAEPTTTIWNHLKPSTPYSTLIPPDLMSTLYISHLKPSTPYSAYEMPCSASSIRFQEIRTLCFPRRLWPCPSNSTPNTHRTMMLVLQFDSAKSNGHKVKQARHCGPDILFYFIIIIILCNK